MEFIEKPTSSSKKQVIIVWGQFCLYYTTLVGLAKLAEIFEIMHLEFLFSRGFLNTILY